MDAIGIDNNNSYGSINTWIMADITDANALITQVLASGQRDLFNPTHINDGSGQYTVTDWVGRTSYGYNASGGYVHEVGHYKYIADPNDTFTWGNIQALSDGQTGYGAWVRSASNNSNPVPEPATMLLFGTGLVGLAGVTIRRRKK